MMRIKTNHLLSALICYPCLAFSDAIFDDREMELLLALGVEDLLTVSIASKKEENIKSAPGIVTVISADEIARYGARNLRDVLDRQTSIQVIGSDFFPHNKSALRGVSSTHADSNVLILLNGRPLRESTVSSLNHDIYAYFPISSLQKIEIIRGPGSVLYGTNAFSGAINLVTKSAPETPSGTASITYGSFGTKQTQINGGGKWGDLELTGAVQTVNNKGDGRSDINGEFGTSGTYEMGDDGRQLMLNLAYRGFTVNALHSDVKSDSLQSVYVLPSTVQNYQRQFIDIGYQHAMTHDWSLAANFSFHGVESSLDTDTTPPGKQRSYLYELTSTSRLTERLNVIVGATYRSYGDNSTVAEFSTHDKSMYTQWDYQAFDWLKVIGGMQYNKPESISADVSPRIAFIAQINDKWTSKVMYGKAFREASGTERFLNVPGVIEGNEMLSPETIKTFDIQFSRQDHNSLVSLTYFHSLHEDLISRVSGSPTTTINDGDIKYDGIELEWKWQVNKQWELLGNASYQTNERNDGADDMTYAPDLMIKTGVSYDSLKGMQLSVFNSYFAESTLQNDQWNTVTSFNNEAKSYNLLTANIRFNLGKVLNNPSFSKAIFSVYGDNLLNQDIYFPSISRTSVNSIPHHAGRGVYATIEIGF
jgi:outer membrane receptor for ferrienterochelin and colicins